MDLESVQQEKKNRKIDDVLAHRNDELDLDWKHLKDRNIEYLSGHDLAYVSSLNLIGNELTFRCINSIHNMNFNSLEHILLNFNCIGRKGCKLLTKDIPRNLKILSLDSCQIDDYGISHLAKTCWKQLTLLSMDENIIVGTNIGVLMRISAPKMEKLEMAYNPLFIPSSLGLGFPQDSFGAKRFLQYKI